MTRVPPPHPTKQATGINIAGAGLESGVEYLKLVQFSSLFVVCNFRANISTESDQTFTEYINGGFRSVSVGQTAASGLLWLQLN